MKDKIKLELDFYEAKTVVNALNQLREKAKAQNLSTDIVDELLCMIIDEMSKKKTFVKTLRKDDGRRY